MRRFFARGSRIERTNLKSDFAGVDYVYMVNHHCPVAVRHRPDRPAFAARIDITLRDTEPAKIAAGTYAPIAIFVWTRQGLGVAGRGIDVYRMHEQVTPPLKERIITPNGDGSGFLTVGMDELDRIDAILRIGDRDTWVSVPLDADRRIKHIVDNWIPRR